jgi:hypothetical protein
MDIFAGPHPHPPRSTAQWLQPHLVTVVKHSKHGLVHVQHRHQLRRGAVHAEAAQHIVHVEHHVVQPRALGAGAALVRPAKVAAAAAGEGAGAGARTTGCKGCQPQGHTCCDPSDGGQVTGAQWSSKCHAQQHKAAPTATNCYGNIRSGFLFPFPVRGPHALVEGVQRAAAGAGGHAEVQRPGAGHGAQLHKVLHVGVSGQRELPHQHVRLAHHKARPAKAKDVGGPQVALSAPVADTHTHARAYRCRTRASHNVRPFCQAHKFTPQELQRVRGWARRAHGSAARVQGKLLPNGCAPKQTGAKRHVAHPRHSKDK